MSLDPRPLSERFDLTYVQRPTWPHRLKFWISVALVLATGVVVAGVSIMHGKGGLDPLYTPGPLSHSHAYFGNQCEQCHERDPARSSFWLPVTDRACLNCHQAAAHHPLDAAHPGMAINVDDRLGAVLMSTRCADCHGEHHGIDYNLNRVPDLMCVRCHGDLAAARAAAAKDGSTIGGLR